MIKILAQNSSTAWAIPWYVVMTTINIVCLVYCVIVYKRSLEPRDGKDATYRKWMRIMGVIFTVVSAYRAIAVVATPYTFRIPNTFAEVAFAGLFGYAMLRFNAYLPAKDDGHPNKFKTVINKSPYILIGCIILAQPIDTWGGFTNFALTSVYVETLWGIGFLSILPLAIIQLRRVLSIKDKETQERFRMLRYSAIMIAVWCVVYCMYRWIFTLPGMWSRGYDQLLAGLPPILTGEQALIDALGVRIPSSWEYGDWGIFYIIWRTAYFSILTWMSLFLMNAPRPREISETHSAKQRLINLSLITIALITLITIIALPAGTVDLIILLILGGILLIPIVYFIVWEIKGVKSKTK